MLNYQQYIDLDNLSSEFSDSSLRITTRQTFQFHGVLKKNLKRTISNISKMLITTYGACGDVVRNVTTIAAPIKDVIHEQLRKDMGKSGLMVINMNIKIKKKMSLFMEKVICQENLKLA